MNVLLAEDGQHYLYTHVRDGRVLVIDIGGFTTDFLAVSPGGVVDYSLAKSVPLGIQSVISDFEDSFKSNHLEAVKDTPVLPPDRVRKAIATMFGGLFEFPGNHGHFATLQIGTNVGDLFALKVEKDIQPASILAGDFLICDQVKKPQPGDMAIFALGPEGNDFVLCTIFAGSPANFVKGAKKSR